MANNIQYAQKEEENTMEKILEILAEINDTIDYKNEKALIDDKLIESLDLLALISELEDAFDISIGMEAIIPENFNSVEAIHNLVESLK